MAVNDLPCNDIVEDINCGETEEKHVGMKIEVNKIISD